MSEFNISIESGTSKRLPVGNKWSEKDIIVTATGGTEDLNDVLNEQESLIDELKAVLEGKAEGKCNHTIETWVFTLEDGSIVEKAVVVDA